MTASTRKGILIDPFKQVITAVEVPDGLKPIYDALDSDSFDSVRLSETETMYVDDYGLLREKQAFFRVGRIQSPYAGRALVLGVDDEGESVDTKLSPEFLQAQINWVTMAYVAKCQEAGMFAVRFNDEIISEGPRPADPDWVANNRMPRPSEKASG